MAYDKPKIDIINKKYETLSKGLEKMYGDVAKNQAAIRKRNQAQQKAEITRLKKYQDRFIKGTSKNFTDANQIIGNINDKDFQNQFTADLNGQFKDGLVRIKNYIDEGGHSDADIEAYVQKMITGAKTFTNGLIGANQYANQRDKAFEKNAQTGGKGVGSLVVDDNYPQILGTLGGQSVEDVDFGNLRITGDLISGVKIFTDKEEDDGQGNMVRDGQPALDGEILDLNKIGQDYKDGKIPPFTKIESYEKYKSDFNTVITRNKANKAYYKEVLIENEDGTQTKKYYIDKVAAREYWLEGDGAKYVNNAFTNTEMGNPAAMIQKVGGTELLSRYTALEGVNTPEAEEERKKIELIAKTAFVESIDGDLQPDQDKALTSKSFSSGSTYTYHNPGHDAIYEVAKENHEKTKDVIYGAHTGANNLNTGLAGMRTNFMNKYIKATGGNRDTGHGMITDIQVGASPTEYVITMQVNNPTDPNNTKQVQLSYNFADQQEKEFFERDILNGAFPSARADGTLKAMVSAADRGDDVYKGKTTTRSNTRTGGAQAQGVSAAAGQQQIDDSRQVKTSQEMLDEYLGNNQQQGGGTGTNTGTNTGTGGGGTTTNTSVTGGNANTTTSTVVGPANFNTTNFVINPNGGIAPAQGASPDATSSVILSIMNDEDTMGASGGGGVGNFGFTGGNSAKGQWLLDNAFTPILKQLKVDYPGLDQKQYEAMAAEEAIEKYIIGKGSPTMGEKNTTIMSDLGVSYDQFDKLPADLKRTLIDYKLNSGRSSKDLIAVALGKETGEDAYLDTKVSEVDKFVKGVTYDAATLAKLTPQKLEEARNDMYLAPIKVISESLISNPKGNAKIGNVTLSYADRVKAADSKWTAWVTSQGLRGGGTGDQGNYGVIGKLTAKPSTSCKAVNFKSVIDNNNLPTDKEFDDAYNNAKKGDLLITPDGEVKRKL